jgi:choline dehydrogenase-like flavoprotein
LLNAETIIATVLVVEYGYFENNISQIQPQSARSFQRKHLYNVTSTPQLGLYNRTSTSFAAAVVGGGSTVNGMFLNRGAADDYNNWEKLGNPGWNFEGILPYFIKVSRPRPSPKKKKKKRSRSIVEGS